MIIVPPAKALANFERGEVNHAVTFHNQILLHRNREFTEEQYHEVGRIARDFLGFDLQTPVVNTVMKLFPANYVRFSLNEEESEQEGYVHDSLCRFFMACPYPTYGDKVDIDAFMRALRARVIDWMVEYSEWKEAFSNWIFTETGCCGHTQFFNTEKSAIISSIDLYITKAETPIEVRVYNPRTRQYVSCIKSPDDLNLSGSTRFNIDELTIEPDGEHLIAVLSRCNFDIQTRALNHKIGDKMTTLNLPPHLREKIIKDNAEAKFEGRTPLPGLLSFTINTHTLSLETRRDHGNVGKSDHSIMTNTLDWLETIDTVNRLLSKSN